MKTKFYKILVIFLSLAFGSNIFAQKDFDPTQRDHIADHVDKLIGDFAKSLEFDVTIENVRVEDLRNKYGDSLAIVKIDSIIQDKRNQVQKNILDNLYTKRNKESSGIQNFFFDKSIISIEEFSPEEFVDQYTHIYNRAVKGDVPIFYNESDTTLRPLMRKLSIDKVSGGNAVIVSFQITRLQMFYDTASKMMQNIQPGNNLPEYFETRLNLAAKIHFKDPDNPESFSILSLNRPGVGGGMKFSNDEVNDFINQNLIKNFSLYSNISQMDQPPDLSLSDRLINMFNDPDKKSIQCDLFFSNEVCDGQTDISVREYVDKLVQHYERVYPIIVLSDFDKLTRLSKTKAYYLFKLPVRFAFEAKMHNGDYFKNNDKPHTDSDTTSTNIFIKLDYKKSPFSKEEEFISVKIVDIAYYDKKIVITNPPKKGNWSLMAKYQPGMMLFSTNESFDAYKNEFSLSNGIGLSGQYYWYANKDNRLNHDICYGVSLGVNYEMYKSVMGFDQFNYSDIEPGKNDGDSFHDLDFVNRLNIDMVDIRPELAINSISFPVMGHYKRNLGETTFLDLAGGVEFSIPMQESVDFKIEGTTAYTGTKIVEGSQGESNAYFIDYLPSKGFDEYTVKSELPETNSMVTYLILNPSLSFSINNTIENGFIDLGLNFQYGFNDLFAHTDSDFMVDSYGNTYNVFSNGVKGNHVIVGISVGFRYFNEKKEKIFKPINE